MAINTAYFGNIDWYRRLLTEMREHPGTPLDQLIDSAERWQKQTERNRCSIVTANGVQMLTVPVTVPSSQGENADAKVRNIIRTADVMVSNHGNWQHIHWNAICSAYGMSPFFEFYADEIEPLFRVQNPVPSIVEHNLAITSKILELLGVTEEVLKYDFNASSDDSMQRTYYQTFLRRHGFIPDMSILDLLFNMGNEAILEIINKAPH